MIYKTIVLALLILNTYLLVGITIKIDEKEWSRLRGKLKEGERRNANK